MALWPRNLLLELASSKSQFAHFKMRITVLPTSPVLCALGEMVHRKLQEYGRDLVRVTTVTTELQLLPTLPVMSSLLNHMKHLFVFGSQTWSNVSNAVWSNISCFLPTEKETEILRAAIVCSSH